MKDKRLEKSVGKLADRFMELRLQQGLSHEKLGQKAGLHWTTIGIIERKKRTPSVLTCMKISHALGVRLADLLSELEPDA